MPDRSGICSVTGPGRRVCAANPQPATVVDIMACEPIDLLVEAHGLTDPEDVALSRRAPPSDGTSDP